MSTALKVYINTGTVDDVYGVGTFTEMDLVADYLIFSAGSTGVVDDDRAIPGSTQLNQAGVIILGTDVVVPRYFLADASYTKLREIHLAGNQKKRYVFCFSFDGATASEPVLELWDDNTLDTFNLYSLGTGVAANSWWRGITTTAAIPTDDWINNITGSKLAGSASSYFLWLNNGSGALSVAGKLYCQLKVTVPASFANPGTEQPVIVIKFTTN